MCAGQGAQRGQGAAPHHQGAVCRATQPGGGAWAGHNGRAPAGTMMCPPQWLVGRSSLWQQVANPMVSGPGGGQLKEGALTAHEEQDGCRSLSRHDGGGVNVQWRVSKVHS